MVIETASGKHKVPFADEFTILVHMFGRDGRMQISLEERVQSADKAWWKDAKLYRCKSVSWNIKCPRVIDRVYSVFFSRVRELELKPGNGG